jgi:uncharacterized secreted protein with C-terminal beta-propeller domain
VTATAPLDEEAGYDAVYAALEDIWRLQERDSGGSFLERLFGGGNAANDGFALATEEGSGAGAPDTGTTPLLGDSWGADYTGTNVQVEGIDEGDIVKTDGETIFVHSNGYISLVKADGADSTVITRIDVSRHSLWPGDVQGTTAVNNMMIQDNVLAVLVQRYPDNWDEDGNSLLGAPSNDALVLFYDVSDPTAPELLNSLGQDGEFRTARLQDGILYLVSTYWVPEKDQTDPAEPASFAPCLTRNGKETVMPMSDIVIWEQPQQTQYVVVSAVSMENQERIGQEAFLGGAETVYMSPENLYLTSARWNGEGVTAVEKAFGIDSDSNITTSYAIRLSLDSGELSLAAQGAFPGTPVNQFALDEFEGHLRVATTVMSTGGWEPTRSALYILDQDLAPVGEIEELATDESVQSVRFVGAVGYVVTFRQTDPLFAIDLTDPAAPRVMSALKIPGFSAYLHPWSGEELLGLGYAGDEMGLTGGLKLSMFDVADPFDVTEDASMNVRYDESPALWDHHAILVEPERGFIGFPVTSWGQYEVEQTDEEKLKSVEDGPSDLYIPEVGPTVRYVVYDYSAGAGFSARGHLNLSWIVDYDTSTVRGLRIGQFLYVCGPTGVGVWEIESLEYVGQVTLPRPPTVSDLIGPTPEEVG